MDSHERPNRGGGHDRPEEGGKRGVYQEQPDERRDPKDRRELKSTVPEPTESKEQAPPRRQPLMTRDTDTDSSTSSTTPTAMTPAPAPAPPPPVHIQSPHAAAFQQRYRTQDSDSGELGLGHPSTTTHPTQTQRDTSDALPRVLHETRPLTRSPPPAALLEDSSPRNRPAQLQRKDSRPLSSIDTSTHLTVSTRVPSTLSYGGGQKEKQISDDDSQSPSREQDQDAGVREARDRPPYSRRSSRHMLDAPLPALPRSGSDTVEDLRRGRTRTIDGHPRSVARSRSGLDWIIPHEEKPIIRSRTISQRLQPTIDIAIEHRDKFAKKAKYTGYLLNSAIGLQILFGSLTTGLSAVATTGRQMALQTTILGGMTTIIAGYLARTRGSNEPELSKMKVKDLDRFIREATSFVLDFGHLDDPKYDPKVEEYRQEFEELLAGTANQERKAVNATQGA